MINTKKLVVNISDVPSYWVFQYYLNLSEKLTGQDIKIKSIFNPSERTPSMCLYVDKASNIDGSKAKQYVYKDFSTGKYGNKIHLVMYLFDIQFAYAVDKIVNDYNKFIQSETFEDIVLKPQARWKVDYIKKRQWTKPDANFWLPFNIGVSMLAYYNVYPIEYYNLVLEEDGNNKSSKISGPGIYGYFDKDDNVYKIYKPYSKKHKFFKVKPHLQGLDQLEYNQPYLIICSSLKDAMCIKSMGYNIEVLAPDSENTVIKPYVLENLKTKYKKIITLFDNDEAGKAAVNKYNKLYNIPGIVSPLCKDISDAMKEYGFDSLHKELKPLLKNVINNG